MRAFIEHRRDRRQILQCLEQGIADIRQMVPQMYKDISTNLYPAAARSVLAHWSTWLETAVFSVMVSRMWMRATPLD